MRPAKPKPLCTCAQPHRSISNRGAFCHTCGKDLPGCDTPHEGEPAIPEQGRDYTCALFNATLVR